MGSTARHVIATTAVLLVGAAAAGGLFVWSGVYDVGADAPHTRPVHALLDYAMQRSVARRANELKVPSDLSDAGRVRRGAGNYEAMCAQCHLAPGVEPTEIHRGLYPEPPKFAEYRTGPARAFWIVKHGIKASGMPAWGKSVDDDSIWDMAAFLQKLPGMDANAYREIVEDSGGHSHGIGGSGSSDGRSYGDEASHAHGDKATDASVALSTTADRTRQPPQNDNAATRKQPAADAKRANAHDDHHDHRH